MQPHDPISRSPPFISVLTHPTYFVAVFFFTRKYLCVLVLEGVFQETLLKAGTVSNFEGKFPVIIFPQLNFDFCTSQTHVEKQHAPVHTTRPASPLWLRFDETVSPHTSSGNTQEKQRVWCDWMWGEGRGVEQLSDYKKHYMSKKNNNM